MQNKQQDRSHLVYDIWIDASTVIEQNLTTTIMQLYINQEILTTHCICPHETHENVYLTWAIYRDLFTKEKYLKKIKSAWSRETHENVHLAKIDNTGYSALMIFAIRNSIDTFFALIDITQSFIDTKMFRTCRDSCPSVTYV